MTKLPAEWYEDVRPGVRRLVPPGVDFEWLDVVLEESGTDDSAQLLQEIGLPSEIVEAAIDPDRESMRMRQSGISLLRLELPARILVDSTNDYLLSIVHVGDRLVTIRRRTLGVVEDACAGIADRDASSATIRAAIAELGDEFLDRLLPSLRGTARRLDEVEAEIEDKRALRIDAMSEVRRILLGIDRHLDPLQSAIQRSILDAPAGAENPELDPMRGLQERANWLEQRVHGQLDRARVLSDREHVLAMDDLSTSMYRLSWIATIFLPLTFVTGLLGINVGGIPFATAPTGFWMVCGVLIVIAGGTTLALALVVRSGRRRARSLEHTERTSKP